MTAWRTRRFNREWQVHLWQAFQALPARQREVFARRSTLLLL
jgi:hypothetical protein